MRRLRKVRQLKTDILTTEPRRQPMLCALVLSNNNNNNTRSWLSVVPDDIFLPREVECARMDDFEREIEEFKRFAYSLFLSSECLTSYLKILAKKLLFLKQCSWNVTCSEQGELALGVSNEEDDVVHGDNSVSERR